MAIKITKEEFEKKFGHPPLSGAPKQAQPTQPGFLGEAKSRVSDVVGQMGQQFRGEGEFAGQSDIRKATGVVAQASSIPLGLAKDVLPEVAEKGLEKVGQGIGKGLQWIAEKTTPQFLVDFVTNHPDAAKALEEATGTVANVGEIAGDILAIQGGVAGTKKVITKTAEGVSKVIPPIAETTGRVLKKAGEKSYSVTVIPEESTRLGLQAYEAKQGSLWNRVKNFVKGEEVAGRPITEASTAARKGLVGTEWRIGVQAKQISQDLWKNTIAPKLDSVKGRVKMQDFFRQVEKEIRKTANLNRKNDLLEGLEALKEPYKTTGGVSLTKLQGYKEGWAEFIPEATYKGKPIASSLKAVKDIAAEKARQIIYKHGGEEIRQAYIDYGNLKSIMKSGIKSIADPAKRSISRNIWEFLMDKTITPVATFGGKVLYRTGEGLEFIGKRGATKVKDVIK